MELRISDVGVLDKTMAVLAAIEGEPRTLAELVAATGISRATAHRLATALEVHGMVRRDGDGRFLLGPRALELGRSAQESWPLREAARDPLRRLRDDTEESVQLFVREGERRVCVVSLQSPHGLRTIVPEGASLPLDLGSGGAALLASPAVRERGWSESVGEREPGVASVSAPVYDGDVVVASVCVSGPIERLTRRPGSRYAAAVMRAARHVERAAGIG